MIIKENNTFIELDANGNTKAVYDDELVRAVATKNVDTADVDDVEWGYIWFPGMTREQMIEASMEDIYRFVEEQYNMQFRQPGGIACL